MCVSIVRPIIGHLEKNDIKIHWKRGTTIHSAHHKKNACQIMFLAPTRVYLVYCQMGFQKQGREREREREYLERALDQPGRDAQLLEGDNGCS